LFSKCVNVFTLIKILPIPPYKNSCQSKSLAWVHICFRNMTLFIIVYKIMNIICSSWEFSSLPYRCMESFQLRIRLRHFSFDSIDEQIMFMILYTINNKDIFLKQICTQAKLLDWQLFLYGGMGNILINVNTFTHLLNKSKDWFIERRYIYIYSTFSNKPSYQD
jgi:hypothetical protein